MTFPFCVGDPARVSLGDGGAHSPQIRFFADDCSCKWNGFPVCIDAEQFEPSVPQAVFQSQQLIDFTTIPGGGGTAPSTAEWPRTYVYDYLHGLLSGYRLQARIRFFATSAGTSVGSVAVQNQVGNCTPGKPGPILGAYDSGFFDITCLDCTTFTGDTLILTPLFTNFSPISGSVTISGGFLDIQWVASGYSPPEYAPNQPFKIQWVPPCDPNSGLYIALETDGCGFLTKTYQQVHDAVNALGLGVTAQILGGHGADRARPDPSCPAPDYCCDMTGAICSGSIDN